MEAKELMIGDLVMCPTITPELRVCRIVDIDGSRDCVGVYDIKDEDEYLVGKYAKYLKPIPLTEEILKVNGFNFESRPEHSRFISIDTDDVYIGVMHYDDSVGRFFTEMDVNSISIHIELHFVHELQHALRICGLNDLAYNFKLE